MRGLEHNVTHAQEGVPRVRRQLRQERPAVTVSCFTLVFNHVFACHEIQLFAQTQGICLDELKKWHFLRNIYILWFRVDLWAPPPPPNPSRPWKTMFRSSNIVFLCIVDGRPKKKQTMHPRSYLWFILSAALSLGVIPPGFSIHLVPPPAAGTPPAPLAAAAAAPPAAVSTAVVAVVCFNRFFRLIRRWSESRGRRRGEGSPHARSMASGASVFYTITILSPYISLLKVPPPPAPTTYCFSLDVQKVYGTEWRSGLWKKVWEIGIRGNIRRMTKNMTECARGAVMLDGEISKYICWYFRRSCTGMYTYHPIYSRYTSMTW